MATTRFNSLILESARRLKDERTDPSSGGDTGRKYNSALLTQYANRAIRDFLVETYKQIGEDLFVGLFPELVRESGALSLTSGVVAKPTDAWFVFDLIKSDDTVRFEKIPQEKIFSIRAGKAGLYNASATHPKFFEEEGNIKTLGVTTGDVKARYIKTHQDIAVNINTTPGGNYLSSGTPTYTAATKTLAGGTMAAVYAATDEGKFITFKSSDNDIWIAKIKTFVSTTWVILEGDGLPAADKSVTQVHIPPFTNGTDDLILNQNWYGEIIARMVAMGLQDASNQSL